MEVGGEVELGWVLIWTTTLVKLKGEKAVEDGRANKATVAGGWRWTRLLPVLEKEHVGFGGGAKFNGVLDGVSVGNYGVLFARGKRFGGMFANCTINRESM